MEELEKFRKIFWDAFYRPNFKSDKIKTVWEKLEPINNWLSGPFFSIYEKGNCDYLLKDQHRFSHINTPDDFLDWCIALVEQYKKEMEDVEISNEEERKDIEVLVFQTDMKMELSDLAYQIQSKRTMKSL